MIGPYEKVFINYEKKKGETNRISFYVYIDMDKKKYIFVSSGLIIGGYIHYQTHIEETPITHRKRFMLFNSAHLKEIEDAEKGRIFKTFKDKILPPDHVLTRKTLQVGNRLFKANKEIPEVSNINWKLTVIDSNIVNACAFPVNY